MSSDAYNPPNYQGHVKYSQHIQQQQHYQQSSYINQNQAHQQHLQQQHSQPCHQQPQQPAVHQYQQQNVNLNQQQQSSTNLYLSLLGIADSMLKSNQHLIAIHCLETILTLKNQEFTVSNLHVQLKTRLRLCRMYLKYTLNTNQYVNAHVEKSKILVTNLNLNDEFRYEATYLIYKIIQKQKLVQAQLKQNMAMGQKIDQSQLTNLYNIEFLQKTLETSANVFPVWHCRLLFLIADILAYEKDFNSAAHFLNLGINFSAKNRISTYTYIMFILSKGLVHLLQRNPTDLQTTMQPCASLIEGFKEASPSQNESLKIFFLVLQVTYFLQCGQMKSVKSTLKHLQIYVQNYVRRVDDSSDDQKKDLVENFQWLHKDHLGILVYLLTVIHYLQTGCFEKAQHNSEKALLNIQRLKLKEQEISTSGNKASSCLLFSYNSEYVTNVFHMMIVESMIRCNISIGNRCTAIRQIGDLFQLCDKDVRLMNSNASQLHCLLGMYSFSVNLKEQALLHFNQSLKNTQDPDLWSYNAMNSAVCYMELSKTNANYKPQLMSILENLQPEKLTTKSTSLTAFSHYFRALKYFLNSNYQQAKESLKEAILLSNSEDLSNVTANSYLFMGQIDKIINSFQESFDMVTNGLDIAEKMPDINLRVFANNILKEMFKFFNDPRENSTAMKCTELEQIISTDSIESLKMPQHALIEWNSNISPSNLLHSIQKITLLNTETKNQAMQPQNLHQANHSPQPQQQQMLQSPKSQQQAQPALQSPKPSHPIMQNSPQQIHQSPIHHQQQQQQQQNQHHHQNIHHQQAQFQNKTINHIQQNNTQPKQQISPQSQKHQYNMNQVQSHISPQQHMSSHHHMSPQQQQQQQQIARHSPHSNQIPNQHMQQHQVYQQYHHQHQHHSPGSVNSQQYQHQQYQQQYHQGQSHGNIPMSPQQQQYQIQLLQQQQQQHHIQQQMLMNQGQIQPQNNRQI